MSKSDSLRKRKNQHLPKNVLSKGDDKKVLEVMKDVVRHLGERFKLDELGYYTEYVKQIRLAELIDIINSYEKRTEFATLEKEGSFMRPDGGVLLLKKKDDPKFVRIIVAVEMKHQGTNKKRLAEGKPRQSQGNAIERLGKNLIGIRATLQYEKVTPFVCFGWGDDFEEGSSILDRVITLNEFYPLNRIFVHKTLEGYSPVSLFFREEPWSREELFDIIKEIAEASVTTYIY